MKKVAILKPHHGPVGGFERVVARIENILDDAGFDVTRYSIDMTRALTGFTSVDPTDREFASYRFGRDQFDGLSTTIYDLVVSTSPPSFTHRHRAHLALFYHHHRVFYDLEDLYIAAGLTPNPEHHKAVAATVRELDADRISAVRTFLCPSQTVGNRLAHFNGRTDTMPFLAGVGINASADEHVMAPDSSGALCVTRHEFPKRTELFVAAAHLLRPEIDMTCTGSGGRLPFAQALDADLSTGKVNPNDLDETQLWCNPGTVVAPTSNDSGRVNFVGHVTDHALGQLYHQSRCVVAPAYDEDYGLTAIEAMARSRPVIVCEDGGGLAELVDHEETGLIVKPEPQAIAEAIHRLHDDDELAAKLGHNGQLRASALTWKAAERQFLDAVERTLDTAPN